MFSPKKMTKTSKGRQKIEIKKLEQDSKQQVTFSKRRAGLFKKASELCVLCGAEVTVIVFSPKDKVFCFGHPDVETVLDRFRTGNTYPRSSQKFVPVNEFNRQYAEDQKVLEMEKKRIEEIEEAKKLKAENGGFWWDEPMDENMGLEELQQYMWALQETRRNVEARLDEMKNMRGSLLPSMDMGMDVGINHVDFGNDFVNWENFVGNGGFVDTHGFEFGHGQF